jgi:hypothetical protein
MRRCVAVLTPAKLRPGLDLSQIGSISKVDHLPVNRSGGQIHKFGHEKGRKNRRVNQKCRASGAENSLESNLSSRQEM